MKKIVSALFQRPRSLGPGIVRTQSSHTAPCSPTNPSSSSQTKRSRSESANPQPKPFFHRWLDTWKTQNGGDHGQSR
jgi:hypothetical protein